MLRDTHLLLSEVKKSNTSYDRYRLELEERAMDRARRLEESADDKLNDESAEIGRKQYSNEVEHGLWLADKVFGDFFESNNKNDPCRNEVVRAHTALMMYEGARWVNSQEGRQTLARLNESITTNDVAGFIDYIMPAIRAAFPNMPHHDLVTVWPTTKPTASVFYAHYSIGRTKGTQTRGTRVFDALAGYGGQYNYTGEWIDQESVGQSNPGSAVQTGSLAWIPVSRATATITFDETVDIVVRDDGNGSFTLQSGPGGLSIAASSLDYETGAWAITFNRGSDFAGGLIASNYAYDQEYSPTIPELHIEIQNIQVQTKFRRIKHVLSSDAKYDFEAEFGQSLDAETVRMIAAFMIAEASQELSRDLWNTAGAPVNTFSKTVPGGAAYSRREHYGDWMINLEQIREQIYAGTQRAHGTWVLTDTQGSSFLKAMSDNKFQADPVDQNTLGVQKIGTLAGMPVYKDPHLGNYPGATGEGNFLIGHKGNDVFDSGYVWVPYRMYYQTRPHEAEDFVERQGHGMRYGKRVTNPALYKRGALSA